MSTPDNKSISDSENIANCWVKIKSAKGTDFFVDTFYKILFKHHPDVRPLFPDDLKTQKTSLLSMLNSVVSGIEFIDNLESNLTELGEIHKHVGITKEMYNYFIAAIVTAANLSSDFSFTDEELESWESAFRKISDIMLKTY